jgi:hypothetical protein
MFGIWLRARNGLVCIFPTGSTSATEARGGLTKTNNERKKLIDEGERHCCGKNSSRCRRLMGDQKCLRREKK